MINEPTKRKAPSKLLEAAKLSHVEKMAIFNERIFKVLRFLIQENYSSLGNIGKLLNVPSQTSSRICSHLCDKGYLSRVEVDIGLARSVSVFQPTNTGIMFAINDNEEMPKLRDPSRVNPTTVYNDLKLQQIRLHLESEGYSQFRNSWVLKKDKDSKHYPLDYLCKSPDGKDIGIVLSLNIKYKEYYKSIISNVPDTTKIIIYVKEAFSKKLEKFCNDIDGFIDRVSINEL